MLNDCRRYGSPIMNESEVETAQNMLVLLKKYFYTLVVAIFLIITSKVTRDNEVFC